MMRRLGLTVIALTALFVCDSQFAAAAERVPYAPQQPNYVYGPNYADVPYYANQPSPGYGQSRYGYRMSPVRRFWSNLMEMERRKNNFLMRTFLGRRSAAY